MFVGGGGGWLRVVLGSDSDLSGVKQTTFFLVGTELVSVKLRHQPVSGTDNNQLTATINSNNRS